MGISLIGVVPGDHLNVQELCRPGSGPHWEETLKSWPHLSPLAALQRRIPASRLVSTVLVEVWVSQPKGMSVGELTLQLVCHGVAQA